MNKEREDAINMFCEVSKLFNRIDMDEFHQYKIVLSMTLGFLDTHLDDSRYLDKFTAALNRMSKRMDIFEKGGWTWKRLKCHEKT